MGMDCDFVAKGETNVVGELPVRSYSRELKGALPARLFHSDFDAKLEISPRLFSVWRAPTSSDFCLD